MKVFHYARLEAWNDIVNGSDRSDYQTGLIPKTRLGIGALYDPAVYALLDPMPIPWVKNPHFKNAWEDLKWNIGSLLLEIDINPASEKAYVVDWGHREGFLLEDKNKKGIPKRYLHPHQRAADEAYIASMVPLGDYVERDDELGYSLPEVIFTDHVPLARIQISPMQPLLEEDLRKYREGEDRSMERIVTARILQVPELQPWYIDYQARFSTTEGKLVGRGKEK